MGACVGGPRYRWSSFRHPVLHCPSALSVIETHGRRAARSEHAPFWDFTQLPRLIYLKYVSSDSLTPRTRAIDGETKWMERPHGS